MDIQNLSKYLSALETTSTAQAQSSSNSHLTEAISERTQDQDSYISSLSSADDVTPSSTYESILDALAAYKASLAENQNTGDDSTETATTTTTSTGESSDTESVSGGSGSGSSDSDDDSDSTTVVEQYRGSDGSMYLKTTTTDSEGNETVTITKLGEAPKQPSENGEMPPEPPEDGEVPPPPMDGMNPFEQMTENTETTGTTETTEA